MPQLQNAHVLPVWKELCSHFRKNRLFPLWLSLPVDLITLHQQGNITWKNATDLMQHHPTMVIQSLDELAKINLLLLTNALNFSIWSLTIFAVLLTFFGFSDDYLFNFNLLPLGNSRGFREVDFWFLVILGFTLFIILILLLLTGLSKQRALELSSCIQVELVLRQSTVGNHGEDTSTDTK